MMGVILRKVAEEFQFESLLVSASVKTLHCISGTKILKGHNATIFFFSNANLTALKNVRANKTFFV